MTQELVDLQKRLQAAEERERELERAAGQKQQGKYPLQALSLSLFSCKMLTLGTRVSFSLRKQTSRRPPPESLSVSSATTPDLANTRSASPPPPPSTSSKNPCPLLFASQKADHLPLSLFLLLQRQEPHTVFPFPFLKTCFRSVSIPLPTFALRSLVVEHVPPLPVLNLALCDTPVLPFPTRITVAFQRLSSMREMKTFN